MSVQTIFLHSIIAFVNKKLFRHTDSFISAVVGCVFLVFLESGLSQNILN